MLFVSSLAFAEPETFESAPVPTKYATGLKLEKGWSKNVKFRSALQASLPRHFDWREQGQLTPVRDQGTCGSCYAFSTVAVLQDAIALKDKKQVDLSEQYILSCNTKGWSCNGGNFAHDMHQNPGAVPESEFQYVGQQVACKQGLSHPYKIDSWAYVPSASENEPPAIDEIKAAIYQYGPISAAVGASSKFQSYRTGIFNSCDNTQPNHAITLVGWDDDGQYFIMKNSWGSQWGENGGYMRIKYGCNYIGIAANYVMFKGGSAPDPTPGPNPTPTPTPPPIPKCVPQAIANAGPTPLRIRPNQIVMLGTPARPQTSYAWEINGRFYPQFRTAQIRAQVFRSAIFTVYASTKCGVARSSAMVIVEGR